jgi:structural maintenance of chromosomes protein 5
LVCISQEKSAEELQNKLHELKRSEKDKKERIKKLQDTIEKIKEEIDNPPEVEDPNVIDADRVCHV